MRRIQSRELLRVSACATFLVWIALAAVNAFAQTPPTQPATGPGGSQAQYSSVQQQVYGSSSTQYWIFTPQPMPASALPLIIFMHGNSAIIPGPYQEWIDHLVKRGNIVVYPRYQE